MSSPAFAVLPTPLVEMAFATAPTATPTYVDITSYVRGGSVHRGRQNDLARYEAGTATLRLDNRTRAFDPTYSGTLVNLVANPSVEVDTVGYSTGGTATLLRDAPSAAVGGFGLRLTTQNIANSGVFYSSSASLALPVTAALSYALSVSLRRASAGSTVMYFRIRWFDAANGTISDSTSLVTLSTTTHTRYNMVATAPALATHASVAVLTLAASGIFDFYADAWQFEQASAASAYIDGAQPQVEGVQPAGRWAGTAHASQSYRGGPFYPNVKPMKKIRISAVWNSVTYRLFTGFVETWPQSWPGNRDGVMEISATDGFKALGLAKVSGIVVAITDAVDNDAGLVRITAQGHGAKTGDVLVVAGVGGTTEANGTWTITVFDDDSFDLQGSAFVNEYTAGGVASTYPTQRSDVRISALLDAAGWPAADRILAIGVSQIQPTAYAKTPVLSALQQVEVSENGWLLIANDGRLYFENRHAPYLRSSLFTFTGAHYQVPVVEYDDSQIWNEVIVTRETYAGAWKDDPQPQTKEDATSQTDNFPRTLERSGMTCDTDNECNDAAVFLLTNYKTPAIRISSLQFRGARLPSTLWPQLLVREMGERVTATVAPPAGGPTLSQESFVEGLDIDFAASPTDWNMVLHLSAVGIAYLPYQSGKGFFILGDATYGKVGAAQAGVLAY